MTTLSSQTLAQVASGIARPTYDLRQVRIGIVHLGLGAFHRAHQAEIVDTMLARDPQWGICGVSLKTPTSKDLLAPQDGLYTFLKKSAQGTSARVIGSVRELMFLGSDRAALMARFADPGVRIVSLTVTEKGYCHDPATGQLNLAHPEIVHDLAHPDRAISAPGLLVAGLAARRAARGGGITVLCCDNLPHNGRIVEAIVLAFARAHDASLAQWISTHVTFPCTMVDRIVPATTERDIDEASALIGMRDNAPVVCEPYFQWVMEDRFAGGRPSWEDAGVQFADDVVPFERMKLRFLNGSHSTLAYLGYLAGHEYIWQACSDPDLGLLVERLMAEEIAPTVPPPPGIDLTDYRNQLLTRFRNPVLPHRTQQIAMDGSQKLPQRLLDTVRERLSSEQSIAHLALAIAGWIRYATGVDEKGNAINVADPLSAQFKEITLRAQGDIPRLASGFLALTPVFGDELGKHLRFRALVTANVVSLFGKGVRATLQAHLAMHR
ncbi:MAG: mannitol dehydrogenase family protein [Pseudomonadota bacterium]|nr:mannitol dehydrogenase family protein [Pseudomonadota bacterium]